MSADVEERYFWTEGVDPMIYVAGDYFDSIAESRRQTAIYATGRLTDQ